MTSLIFGLFVDRGENPGPIRMEDMMRKYLQNAKTKEIFPYDGPDVSAFKKENEEWNDVKVVHLRNKDDNRTVVMASSEWNKYGEDEKAKWVQFEPEKEAASILEVAITGGSTKPKAEKAVEQQQQVVEDAQNGGAK